MKKILLGFVALVALASFGTWLGLSSRQKVPDARAAHLQVQLELKDQEIAREREAKQRAEKQIRNIAKASDELMTHASARESALSNALAAQSVVAKAGANEAEAGGKGGFGKMLGTMMSDPEMKKMIMGQQRLMIGQLYNPLIQKLQLSPEQSQAFKELLLENIAGTTEMAASMFSTTGRVDRAEMTKKIAEGQKAMEERVKELLGPDKYAQYQDYQTTVGERAQLGQFRQEMLAEGEAVSNEQVENLLRVMGEEKKQAAAAAGIELTGGMKDQFPGGFSEEQMQQLVTLQEQVNQNVFSRAGSILSPAQLEAFSRHQSNQLQMVKIGLSMARKFMGPE